ncbi:alpha/beta fold hydrolase [Agromyces protaetiae]|uniref:Alpha/beta fold hydrolase n=1 Tax=Agromyces protaetiae TaxID=2509455 RepID=A0A4P6FB65_9MICO|nr:alpha/beta fold hydrolase [Agromyces protaetiae]QAY72965.1 alpha/beta fold hydrolase [Agromyces protaetiae]
MSTPEEIPFAIDVDGTAIPAVAQRPPGARATVVVAHGAGAGMEHPFLTGFSRALAEAGFATIRFDFPYRARGRRMPGRPQEAIDAWRAIVARAHELAAEAGAPGEQVWAAGKSYGGRMASMAAAEERGLDVAGLVFLGYPLHQPGKPEKPRDEHLPDVRLPMLFLQGTNDPFAVPNAQLDEVVARVGANAVLEWIDGGNHSFEVKGRKRPADEIGAGLAPRVAEFVDRHGTSVG